MPVQGTYAAWQASEPVKTNVGEIVINQLNYLSEIYGKEMANKERAKIEAAKLMQEQASDYRKEFKDYQVAMPDVENYILSETGRIINQAQERIGYLTGYVNNNENYGTPEYTQALIERNNLMKLPKSIESYSKSLTELVKNYQSQAKTADPVLNYDAANTMDSILRGQFKFNIDRNGSFSPYVYIPAEGESVIELNAQTLSNVFPKELMSSGNYSDFLKKYVSYTTTGRNSGYNSSEYKTFNKEAAKTALKSKISGLDKAGMPPELMSRFMAAHKDPNGRPLTPVEAYGTGDDAWNKLYKWIDRYVVGKDMPAMISEMNKRTSNPLMAYSVANSKAALENKGLEAEKKRLDISMKEQKLAKLLEEAKKNPAKGQWLDYILRENPDFMIKDFLPAIADPKSGGVSKGLIDIYGTSENNFIKESQKNYTDVNDDEDEDDDDDDDSYDYEKQQ
jgi:hypothetical protein